MLVNKDFEDFVLSIGTKGYSYDQTIGLVVTDFSLSQDEKNKIFERMADFGYESKQKMEADINAICETKEYGREVRELSLLELTPGTIVTLNREFKHDIKLFCIDNSWFYVINDSYNALIPGDKLLLLGGGICAGKDACFKVIRDGKGYPSDDMLYRLNDIISIRCVYPRRIHHAEKGEKIVPKKSFVEVFSWHSSVLEENAGLAFDVQDIHLNNKAMFVLNLKDCEFRLNTDCDISIYAKQRINWFDILKQVSDIVGNNDVLWDNVAMLRPGLFQLTDGVLKITQKMQIRI